MPQTAEKYEELRRVLYEALSMLDEDSLNERKEGLHRVIDEAFAQAAVGKGRERHANDLPFEEQPIMVIPQLLGDGDAYSHRFQAVKKISEVRNLPNASAKKHELLGAINYLAAAVLLIENTA